MTIHGNIVKKIFHEVNENNRVKVL